MSSFSFQVGAVGFHLEGDDKVLAYLRFIYRAFPPPSQPQRRIHIHWQDRKCIWRADDRPASFLLVDDPAHRESATTTLIARLLVELQPDFLILHGNALRHRETGKLLLLVGESGAGKTTLTLELTKEPAPWEPFAEDVLLLDSARAELLPFPRAMALRDPAGFPAAEMMEHGRKLLVGKPPAQTSSSPAPLVGAAVWLLTSPPITGETPQPPSDEAVWVSHLDFELAETLRAAGMPLRRWAHVDGLGCLEYGRPLTVKERAAQAAILADRGAMIFRTQTQEPVKFPAQRPAQPQVARLTLPEGIHQMLPRLVRPFAEFAAQPAGRLFMRLSRAFAQSAIYSAIPGGTPEETAREIRKQTATTRNSESAS